MRNNIFTKVLIVLFTVFNWGCSNDDIENAEPLVYPIDESIISSRSANEFDYSQYTLLENKIIMPRSGESFQGTVIYQRTAFPLYIYWDFEIEDYNLFAYISGINESGVPTWTGDYWTEDNWDGAGYYTKLYQLSHVSSYESESNSSRFDFIIKCNFSTYINNGYYNAWVTERHVAFHVIFYPNTRSCSFDIIVDEEGQWWPDDM